jgi:S-DNA-T family DNA segregation ATPase FtsK/SpoIIIE
VDEKALVDSSAILEQKLATFGVGGRVTAVRPGPVITTYEFEPEAGVKVSRVVNLCDDLTMALRAHGVRIVAPIPGKNCVGIEVSNRNRAVVGLRDLVESSEFRDHRSALALALGRDTTGLPVYADLAKMPHLLMAGATGTGKSVALNTYIVSILYKATPNDVRFIMIDPKMLELSLYEGIPHLLVPVVTDVKKAAAALATVMREMDRRFELMKDKKVRSLDDYNRRIAEERAAAEAEAAKSKGKAKVAVAVDDEELEEGEEIAVAAEPGLRHEHLPRILVIIDELADLMMTVGREVETLITRLAQKARAAGIHLIVATQRPSVDVITGLIKANFPSRISFQVTSRPDSRTILDTVGADRLLGNGDALYMAPGTSHLQRLHGGLVSDNEIKEVVEYLRKQGTPDYRMDILEGGGGDDELEDGEEAYDELYDRAVELVTQHGQGSTSWLQRKLGIGYNRSARIMEMMEREGVVGPADGAKPRKVLVSAL